MNTQELATGKRIPVRAGLFSGPLEDLENLRLAGTQCTSCQEVSLGTNPYCPNCGAEATHPIALSRKGQLWTFTVARNKPPGDYKGPEPFAPFGIGLVELPERLRVMAPIACDIGDLKIGQALEIQFFVQHTDDQGREVVAFRYQPIA